MMAPCLFWVNVIIYLFMDDIHAGTCTRYDDESGTCYIDRSQRWIPSDGAISCDSSYPNCVITCKGDQYSCGSEQEATFPYIICGVHGNKCTINCNSNEACYGSTISTGNYSVLNININAMEQSKMEIYAPNHGTLNIHLLSEYTSFTNNKIHSSPFTTSIFMDCRYGISCNKNIIDAQSVTSSLVYKCDSYCDSTQILCPTAASCDIQCRHSCNNMLISSDDISALHFLCDYKQCKNTMIECMMNDTMHQSQFVSNYNKNGIGSLVGHCTDSRSSDASTMERIEFSADLNVYIYYNQNDALIDDFPKLMHDAIIETYDIISDNDQKHENISGHIINITFCVMFNEIISNQCGILANNNNTKFAANQHESQFVAFGLFNIVSTDVDMVLFKQYVLNILSSDKFLTYFTQSMNVKLFSTNDFHTLAIDIDDTLLVTNNNEAVDDDIAAIKDDSELYPVHMVIVFIVIGLCGGALCSILCAYSVHKWCNSEYLLQKLENDLDKIEKQKQRKHDLEANQQNDAVILNQEHVPKIRAFHWGFTNGNDKYGEVSKFAKDESPESLAQNSERQRKETFSNDVHRNSSSTKNRTSIDSAPKPTQLNPQERESIALKASTSMKEMPSLQQIASEDGNLYEDDEYHFNDEHAQTFNMEQALRQNSFHHKYKRLQHFKSMKSVSSMEIEDLFNSPTISHMEGPKMCKGQTMAATYDAMYNYGIFNNVDDVDADQMYANTMPAFALHPIEISQIAVSMIEKMDDDFDDYDENENELQSSSAKPQSTSCISSPEDASSSESSVDDYVAPTITPLLGPHYGSLIAVTIGGNEEKLSKLSDDSEPELPLSPCDSLESPTNTNIVSIPIAFVCNPQLMQAERRSKSIVINVNTAAIKDAATDANTTKYNTPSYSSTKL